MRFPCTPIPDSGFPNSEFRMAYGEFEIPHHEILGLGGAHEGHMRSAGAGDGGVGHRMSNDNSGVGHSMSWGGTWSSSVKSWIRDYGQRKEGGRPVTSDKEGRNRSKGTETLGVGMANS